jgi:hypothetical protein
VKRIAGALLIAVATAQGVILLDTGDPLANTTAPTGALANSGWQYEGYWNGFIGTPMAPNFFIAAAHIGGNVGDTFTYQNVNYTTVRSYNQNGSDLLIWQVNGAFPSFAPLYTNRDELNKHLIDFGHGTQRGSEMYLSGTLRGWAWGSPDGRQRWGENDVASVIPFSDHDLLYATFDQHVVPGDHPNECHLSAGDSSGGMFINDNGTWKLAGINYAVDDLYYAPASNAQFTAAIFDARGYYATDDGANFYQVSGPDPVPTGFYCSRIASEIPWIYSVIDPNGDPDMDGVPNLMEFAIHMNPFVSDVTGLPQVGREGNFLTLTYNKIATATDLTYTVEQSTNLTSWMTATTQDQVVSNNGNVQTIKSKIDVSSATGLFVRLRVTR